MGVFYCMREWIETNGLGGYASLTQSEELQRKFHGLLISSRRPPVERWILVSNLLDHLFIDNTEIVLKDHGQFSFDHFPTWTYETPYGTIKKTLFMPHEQNKTVIKYDISLQREAQLVHQLYVNSRHFYDTHPQDSCFEYDIEKQSDFVRFNPYNIDESVLISFPETSFELIQQWQSFTYQLDSQRNDSCYDHALYLGNIKKDITKKESYYLSFSTELDNPRNLEVLFLRELQRRNSLLQQSQLPKQMDKLVLASDRFLVRKPPYHTIIAGYHWFSDWGRDTLIALPGITLVTGRYQIAKEILQGLAAYSKQGIIPNTFDDRDNSPAYNTVDASLWYIDRVFQYLKYTNDKEFIRSHYSVFESIISAYQNGTHHNISMDNDYLISHDPGLTWMDVKLGEYYPTPRSRKAVEIQALWYNALKVMSLFAELTENDNPYELLAQNVKGSFNYSYNKLYDVIDRRDASLRPNIVFLASLDYSMISPSIQKQIVECIEEKLLTLFGLRTLAPSDPQYKGSYIGDFHRDLAYHNGTVWPWLLGSFIKAKSRLYQNNADWKHNACQQYLSSMLHVYGDKWDGSIHEIFDADSPYGPRGCISQAWSVAEILRAWVEDILGKRPPYEEIFQPNEIQTY